LPRYYPGYRKQRNKACGRKKEVKGMKRLSLFLVAIMVMVSVSLIGLPVVTEAALSEKKCVKGGGTVEKQDSKAVCKGGKYDGKKVKVKKTKQTQQKPQ